MRLVYDLLGKGNIRIQIIHGAIHHDRTKSLIDRVDDRVIGIIMIRMQADGNFGLFGHLLYHGCESAEVTGLLDRDMLRIEHDDRWRVRCLRRAYDGSCHRIIHTDKCYG